MPIKVLESNNRIAEVQTFCDNCGKLISTSLMSKKEIEAKQKAKLVCWQCKHAQKTKKT